MYIFKTKTIQYVWQKKKRDTMLAYTPQVLVIKVVIILNTSIYIVISKLLKRVKQIASFIINIKAISLLFLVFFQQTFS